MGTFCGNAGTVEVVRAGMSGAGSRRVGLEIHPLQALPSFYVRAGHRHGSVAAVVPN